MSRRLLRRRLFRRRLLPSRLIVALCLASGAAWLWAATPSQQFRSDPDRLVIVTAHWSDRAQLQRIAGHFQHVDVDDKARTARMEASAADLALLRRLGVRVEIDDRATARMRTAEAAMAQRATIARRHLSPDGTMSAQGLKATQLAAQSAIPGYACYRTVEETYATMDQLAHDKPALASVVDIGPTWTWAKTGGAQGYRMRVLRMGNSTTDSTIPDKPHMVVIASIHAREYTPAELATRFAEWLGNGYGSDPEATWLLDNFRFDFILQANPDGRKKAESGISWRKNTDTDNGSCSANAYGVDLNRNFPWRFGSVSGGSSSDPCDIEYRGTSAASEEEVQDILRYAIGTPGSNGVYSGGVLPDRRSDTGTAPADYRGMMLDLHSYSQLVLWPWAYTSATAPNVTQLRTLGRRLAYFNNYKPVQWTGLYVADGTDTDTVYGATGAPSYTIEMGQEFFEDCSTFESTTYPQNFAAMKYAARNLQEPYGSPAGPDTTSMGASATVVAPGQAFAVAAWIDDSRFNQSNGAEAVQAITSASATLDAAPWATSAMPTAMRAYDGAFNSSREQVVLNIDTRNLAYGRHVVYVRGTDASGRAGTPSAVYFTVRPPVPHHDFDGDRHADLLWRNSASGQNVIWRSASSAASTAVATVASAHWSVVAEGDFDGDGRSDVFWRNDASGQNVIWRTGNVSTPVAVATAPDPSWRVAGAGDFDGDGDADVLWRNASSGQDVIWRSANYATPIAVATVANTSWRVAGIGDFDGDGKADILWRNSASGANAIWRSGNAAQPIAITAVTDTAWMIAGVGDVNNDGKDDIVWRNGSNGANVIWLSGSYATQLAMHPVATNWRLASVGDFDGDGFADLLWRNASSGQDVIWKRANASTGMTVATVPSQAWSVVPLAQQS
ncbi:MAG TPA: M14 family zinc carboxypeptidase [Luteimonas sp.]|nr:M14 family zinc carboxypeptidase [Luteimonas sp.]